MPARPQTFSRKGFIKKPVALAGSVLVAVGLGLFLFAGGESVIDMDIEPAIVAPVEEVVAAAPYTIGDLDPAGFGQAEVDRLNKEPPSQVGTYATRIGYRLGRRPNELVEILNVSPDNLFLLRYRLNRSLSEADRTLCKDDIRPLSARVPQEVALVDDQGVEYGAFERWRLICPNADIDSLIRIRPRH